MDWGYLFEIGLTGIASGGLYALAALAFVMVYKATRVVNLAIGEMLMAGGYLFFTFAAMWALPLWLAIPAAVLACGVLGAVIERSMIRPLLGEPPISAFMVTIGLGSVLVGLVEIIWSADLAEMASSADTPLSAHGRAVVHELMAGLYQAWARQRSFAPPRASLSGSVREARGYCALRFDDVSSKRQGAAIHFTGIFQGAQACQRTYCSWKTSRRSRS